MKKGDQFEELETGTVFTVETTWLSTNTKIPYVALVSSGASGFRKKHLPEAAVQKEHRAVMDAGEGQ